MKLAEKDIEAAKEERRKLAHQMKESMFHKGEIDHEVSALKTKYRAEIEQLEKVEPIFSTLNKLKTFIVEKKI